jgi:hypothetical protein
MWIVNVPDSPRIIVRLWLRRIEKSDDGPAICTDVLVNNPPVFVVTLALVVWLSSLLVERVGDALVEYLLWILRASGPFRPRFRVR